MGAWLMHFFWTETLGRLRRAEPTVVFFAVPNPHYKLLWDQINGAPEHEKWDTKQSNSNSQMDSTQHT